MYKPLANELSINALEFFDEALTRSVRGISKPSENRWASHVIHFADMHWRRDRMGCEKNIRKPTNAFVALLPEGPG
ncbi:unnamed protein product [Heligmosomoides polygyrus]|uniref:Transposase n=1 Tax=Heligmosomoides polygyrus TaxID=6339 RepID=A0A183GE32_HELPZ|nr:unnamed protein product [Heligmosomoides polygyrus]